jgi:glycine cleavage system transcriptional repressor
MSHFLLTAAGPDRQGLVAEASKRLYALGCNLEDSSMTRLQGEFAMLLIFSAPPKADPKVLEKDLRSLEKLGMKIFLKPLSSREHAAPPSGGTTRLVTVYGGDRRGIVSRVTGALAEKGFNITDLATHRTGGEAAGYILYIEGEAPEGLSDDALAEALRKGVEDPQLTVTVKSLHASAL